MRSEKPFFEVFPSYAPSTQELRDLLDEVRVTRLLMTTDRGRIRVFLTSDHPIHKKDIYTVEKELARSMDPDGKVKVTVDERFELSSQYDLRNFYDEYKGSIGYEMKAEAPMMYSIYHDGEKKIEGSEFHVTLEPSPISYSTEDDLRRFLTGIFCSRAGLACAVKISYMDEARERDTGEDLEYQKLVDEISKRARDAKAAKEAGAREARSTGKRSYSKKNKGEARPSYGDKRQAVKKSDDPNVIYRGDVQEQCMPISDIVTETGNVTVRGRIESYEDREVKDGTLLLVKFNLTDFTDTIGVRLFLDIEEGKKIQSELQPGKFIKLNGAASVGKYEHELTISSVRGIRKIEDFREKREDRAALKRVELHAHTKYSNMDAVDGVEDLLKRAESWGWKAIAITDHGSVQGFPVAAHTELSSDMKIIYGMEGYLVDDMKNAVDVTGSPDTDAEHRLDDTYCIFDIETTGFSPVHNKIIEIGAVIVQDGKVVDRFDEFVNPEVPIPFRITKLTTITDNMVKDADTIDKVLPRFLEFTRGAPLVGHNVTFDVSFIAENARRLGIPFDRVYADTLVLSRILLPHLGRHKLDRVAKELGVVLLQHHIAVDDAEATSGIWLRLADMLKERGITTLDEVVNKLELSDAALKHYSNFHITILAKNETGRVNLYRLVSLSHLRYFGGNPAIPRIPKSELIKHREGLIIGSACERGELYHAIADDRPEAEIANIVSFYDYLEIMPIDNNRHLIEDDNDLTGEEDLRNINRRIVELGEQWNKPVCATSDSHMLDPEDELFRRVIRYGRMGERVDKEAPLYLRTTEEMLQEFQYLGSDKAREVVIENTNLIADMVDRIKPTRPDKCPPVIPDSDKTLRSICEKRAHELYGDVLPDEVKNRMEKELDSIIGNGYAVMYVIAQKLVWKSNEDGYLVGSRGSVGSSFAAYLAGITEVNSLRPHYLCKKCHYSDFDSEIVMKYHETNTCGIDLPDRECPVCGEKLDKVGFDIPFETFLGFKGDKEPDIDLNFSSDYQSKSHKYTEVIFGSGYAFRAGTIGTMQDKTAYGFAKKYFEGHGMHPGSAELDRVARGCTDVLRTTGQHPGGIVVLPHGEEIDTFTPVQHPADDPEDPTITTHFEYHSIDSNLLKLDNLGHQDPAMIKFLQDMTGVDPTQIPLDDPDVMSLFKDTSALGITSADIGGTPNGSMGLPEFGTDNTIKMVMEAKPQNFTDLVRISGLSHGTDVWAGNAEVLIQTGTATLDTCICCRDDIMLYLIGKGLDSQEAFKIMENVRKGKVAKGKCDKWEEWKQDMLDHGVPEWYVKSCNTIKYMFPKAHAAAYVMMAYRIAWFKVHMPEAYYCGFYSIRAKGFSYEKCCQGAAVLKGWIEDYRKRENTLKDAEKKELHDMRIVEEMYARGIEFCPIDLEKVSARYFKVVDGKIMPALSSIDSIGTKAADTMIANINSSPATGPFLSRDDFCLRSGASPAIADKLRELGILGDIPDSNQLSLFDL